MGGAAVQDGPTEQLGSQAFLIPSPGRVAPGDFSIVNGGFKAMPSTDNGGGLCCSFDCIVQWWPG